MDKDNEKISPEIDVAEVIVSQSQAELAVEENKTKIISPGRMVLKRFFRSKLSVVGLVTLVILFAFSIFGPFISKYGEQTPDDNRPLPSAMDYEMPNIDTISDPDSVLFVAEQFLGGRFIAIEPGDTSVEIAKKANQNKLRMHDTLSNLVLYPDRVGSFKRPGEEEPTYFTTEKSLNSVTIYELERTGTEANGEPVYSKRITSIIRRTQSARIKNIDAMPSWDHWLGTDEYGFDVFTRLMYGGRISLSLSFIVIFIELILGILFGGLAGYFGKWVDQIIMRIIDILNCLPGIPLMLIFSSILDGLGVGESVRIFFLMGMLSLLGWTGIARTVRGQILMLREQEFMVAAEALGLSVPRRIVKHLVPNVMPLLIVGMTLGLGGVILSEATLSFLGMGIRKPFAAWGTMINSANDPIVLQYFPNQWVPAGIMIVLVVLAFNFVGDGL
ncbi:MAG: ABC transporter permease, partial [Firmicutes bacterium]|nr:ABC transporter permease [Bacillota bacterium]